MHNRINEFVLLKGTMTLSQAVISAGIAEIHDCMDAGDRAMQGAIAESSGMY
jgi:hypothetical protein